MEYLDVYLYDRKIGVLSSDNGRMEFRYVPAYLEQKKSEALSFSLPLRSEPYKEDAIIPFFSNLLPDEGIRVRIAEILQVSPDNIFGLLKEIGEDCAGAVAFYSQEVISKLARQWQSMAPRGAQLGLKAYSSTLKPDCKAIRMPG